jgi:hypothetical protein
LFFEVISLAFAEVRVRRFLSKACRSPVVAEGVEYAANAPEVLGSDGADDGGAGGYGAVEGDVGVFGSEDHVDGASVEVSGAELLTTG